MQPSRKSFSLFLIIWAGQLLSKIGSGISAFALGVHLLQTTGATSAYSFLLAAAFLPAVLFAPAGGVIADRKDRRCMMAAGDLGSAFGIFFVIVILLHRPDACWPIYLGAAISSLFAALQSPAFKASVTDILDEKAYAKGSGLIQLAEASQYLIGPILAAAGVFCISIGASPDAVLITCAAFCFFFTLPFVNASLEVLFRQNIANEMQGRVWSLISLITQIGVAMAFGIAGFLADHLFNPLLTPTGLLSDTVGRMIGTGPSRGSGLMVMMGGFSLLLYGLFLRAGKEKPTAAPPSGASKTACAKKQPWLAQAC